MRFGERASSVNRDELRSVETERHGVEETLKGPTRGQVDANAAGRLANPGAEFEQLVPQSLDLRRAPRLRELQTKQVHQVVGEAVQEQAEGVGQKTVATQAVRAKSVLELLDAVLALAAVIVKGKDLGNTTGAVGDHKAQVGETMLQPNNVVHENTLNPELNSPL